MYTICKTVKGIKTIFTTDIDFIYQIIVPPPKVYLTEKDSHLQNYEIHVIYFKALISGCHITILYTFFAGHG